MDFVEIAALVVAVLGLPAVWIAWRTYRPAAQAADFDRVHEYVQGHQAELRSLAWSAAPSEWRCADIPLLVKPGWVLSRPRPLESISLKLVQDGAGLPEAPQAGTGSADNSYSKSLVARPQSDGMFNGVVYRPLRIEVIRGGLRVTCTKGYYFDYLDHGEVLAHEAGAGFLKGGGNPADGPRRRAIVDPFDFVLRPTSLGINTLTIRKSESGDHGFYMHKRGGSYVVNEAGAVAVAPAGEFTPSDISYEALTADFSLWRNIIREYAEEFFDIPESYGRGGQTLDYENTSPYAELSAARDRGNVFVRSFGVAVDPLCYKPELLTVCVFSEEAFDTIFAGMVTVNGEGVLLGGPNRRGIPFTRQNITLYAENGETSGAAAACLKLAWRYRRQLGLV